jgi:hypothetical protein
MSVNCNTIVEDYVDVVIKFDENVIKTKSSLGRSASIAIHAALSDCYKAMETLESSTSVTGGEAVYLRAAINKLETAAQALRGMREILARGRPSDAVISWLNALDYDRLYEVGRKRGVIPADIEQWSRLTQLMRSPDHLLVTDTLIADVKDLEREINDMIDSLLSGRTGAPMTAEQSERLLKVRTGLVQFSTFGQMVSYLNAVKPMDKSWCRHMETADLTSAV